MVDNQTSGNTLQDLTRPLSGKIANNQLSSIHPRLLEQVFGGVFGLFLDFLFWILFLDALPHQPVQIREETLESGNLFSDSWISASVP